MKQIKIVLVATLATVGALTGCEKKRQPKYHGQSLRIDHRYERAISFELIGVDIPIKKENVFIRIDDPVEDIERHQTDLFRELGIEPLEIVYTNPAMHGRQVFLEFADGRKCSFIWVLKNSDDRITRIRTEHEKYHSLSKLAPEGIHILSTRLRNIGFDIDLSKHDEELAATIVEILSLHLMGVPLGEISGSELTVKAKEILTENHVEPIAPADRVERGR